MAPFETFWNRLRLRFAGEEGEIEVDKWSADKGAIDEAIRIRWLDDSAMESYTRAGRPRRIAKDEIRVLYENWKDYRSGKVGREFLVHKLSLHNTAYTIPLLHHVEELMA